MDKIFQRIIEDNFSDLKGSVVDATALLPESLINEFIQTALHGNKTIEAFQISVHGQNQVSANVKTTLLPWSLNLKLKLDKSVDFGSYSSPKIRAWLENNILLGRVALIFNVLPQWIKLYGEQIVVDLGYFLQTPEQKQVLDIVKWVGIKTEESKVILEVKIEI